MNAFEMVERCAVASQYHTSYAERCETHGEYSAQYRMRGCPTCALLAEQADGRRHV